MPYNIKNKSNPIIYQNMRILTTKKLLKETNAPNLDPPPLALGTEFGFLLENP